MGVVNVGVRVSSHLKKELAWAVDKRLRVISTIMLFKVAQNYSCMASPYLLKVVSVYKVFVYLSSLANQSTQLLVKRQLEIQGI